MALLDSRSGIPHLRTSSFDARSHIGRNEIFLRGNSSASVPASKATLSKNFPVNSNDTTADSSSPHERMYDTLVCA